MTSNRHTGKVAVVTGAAQGLGQEYVVRLAGEGARVAALDVGDLSETLDRADGDVIAVTCDVSDPAAVVAAATAVEAGLGSCDILVNNAGVSPNIPWDDFDHEQWLHIIAVNLSGQFLMAKAFTAGMRERRWGRVVNVASNTLGLTIPGFAGYMASKGGVIGFTRALATDLGSDGVTVNAVSPGLTHTPTTDEMWEGSTLFADIAETQALKREGVPADLAGVVSFLVSDDAGWVTGQTLIVDGGLIRL